MVTEIAGRIQEPSFSHKLTASANRQRSWLCVGLDPELALIPTSFPRTIAGIERFCKEILNATSEYAAAIKINFAFFEALGPDGWRVLARVRNAVPSHVPVIADAKRGDIGNSTRLYAEAIFNSLGFDAVTVNPYLGPKSLDAFLTASGKGIYVLCRTSNAGAEFLQDVTVDGEPLYVRVARAFMSTGSKATVGFVVGAQHDTALRRVRALAQDLQILAPGVGAQGASMANALVAGANSTGANCLLPVSRAILYASDKADYVNAARVVAAELASKSWMNGA